MDHPGWEFTDPPQDLEDDNSSSEDNMPDAADSPCPPCRQRKRSEISEILTRLTEHIINAHNSGQHWLMVQEEQEPTEAPPVEELPLDLSVRPRPQPVRMNGCSEFLCKKCGQVFNSEDRLLKHNASRHKKGSGPPKVYECGVCFRKFSRSDMLTRHARLHTGVKPYSCKICGQVFSRSDHLSTHQRTHTGEKPYCCPHCNYAACRRDMITRHIRTHRHAQPA